MSSEENKQRLALIVACDRYEDPELKRLEAPSQDAERFANILEDPKIGGYKVTSLINQPYWAIKEKINEFLGSCSRGDTVLLYFSCHGIKDKNGQLYFATITTNRKWLRATGIESNFVNEVLDECRALQKVVLLDCCYSGAFEKGRVVRADKQVYATESFSKGSVVITASDSMQYAIEESADGNKIEKLGKGGSYFTNALLEGLETGNADVNNDGKITYQELYNYIHDRVRKITPDQSPQLYTREVEGDFVVFQNTRDEIGSDVAGTPKPIGATEDIGKLQINDPILGFIEEAKTLLENEQYDKAIRKFDGILMLREGHIQALNGKGVALCKQKKYEEALECFKEVLKIKPKHTEASVYVDMITDRISKGRSGESKAYNKSLGQETAALEKQTETKVIKALDEATLIPLELIRKGDEFLEKRMYQDAIHCYDQALKIEPHSEVALYKKGNALKKLDHANAWYNEGLALSNLHKYDEAIVCYDKALDLDPNNANAWYNKGLALNSLARYEEAINYFDRGIKIDPNNANAWYNKGYALHYINEHKKAISCYDKALDLDPNNANAWYNKGLAFRHLGRYEEAINYFDKAIGLDPNDPRAWYHKGLVFERLGNRQYAQKCYTMAKELGM
jgi:tetratricopeptide (TPR) repeat protein